MTRDDLIAALAKYGSRIRLHGDSQVYIKVGEDFVPVHDIGAHFPRSADDASPALFLASRVPLKIDKTALARSKKQQAPRPKLAVVSAKS